MGVANEIVIYSLLFALMYYQVFLLLSFFENRKRSTVKGDLPETLPTVTIIVPCYNEESTLTRTVSSLLALDYPSSLISIFLIDDGSTDRTYEVMQSYAEGYPQIQIWTKANEGKFKTLNFGLSMITSDLVGCLDADSFVDPQALKEIVRRFNHNPAIMAVTPSIRIWKPDTLIRRIQNTEYDLGIFVKKTLAMIGAIHITPGPFSLFKKEVFQELGPYRHAHNTEDFEIALRMQQAGLLIDNAHKAIVYTVGPPTLYKLYTQRVRWTAGFLKNLIEYRELLLNNKYGALSALVLPISLVSVFGSLYFVGVGLLNLISELVNRAEAVRLIGFDLNLKPSFNFEWFFVNTHTIHFLSLVLIGITILFILLGKYLTAENKKISHFISPDLFYFLVLYGFIAPFWLLKSTYNTVVSKEAPWR